MLEAILWFTCNKIIRALYKRERERKGELDLSYSVFTPSFLFRFPLDRNKRRFESSRELRKPDGRWQKWCREIRRLFPPRWSFGFFRLPRRRSEREIATSARICVSIVLFSLNHRGCYIDRSLFRSHVNRCENKRVCAYVWRMSGKKIWRCFFVIILEYSPAWIERPDRDGKNSSSTGLKFLLKCNEV